MNNLIQILVVPCLFLCMSLVPVASFDIANPLHPANMLGGIVKLMKSKAGPTSKLLESVADAVKFLDTSDYSIIGK